MSSAQKQAPITRGRYKRNFLSQVIVRIDFATPIELPKSGPSSALLNRIKQAFPIPEQKLKQTRHINVLESGVTETAAEKREWYFYGKNREKILHWNDEALSIEYKTYSTFEMLKEDFAAALEAFFKQFPETQIKRLGLRYIDSIEIQEGVPHDWKRFLTKPLLATFSLADDPSTITRVFNVIEFNYGDVNLRFQFGMPNPDYPARIRKKLFILDYDAYCTLLLGRDEIDRYLNQFHEKIKASFEEVITDDLRSVMGDAGA